MSSGNNNNKNNSNSDNSIRGNSDAPSTILTTSESGPSTEIIIPKIVPVDSTAMWDYLQPRIILSSVVGSIGGATAGYYIGDKTAIYFYKYGFATGCLGASFFTLSYTIRHFRGNEDIWNDTASAAITLGALNLPSGGYKPALQGVALGMVLGSAYWVSSHLLYQSSRAVWLQNRRHVIQYSRDRTPKDSRPRMDRSEIMLRNNQQQEINSDKKFGFFFKIEDPKNKTDPYTKWMNAREKSSVTTTTTTPSDGSDKDGGPEKKT